jgi:hypothetical protein
MVLVALTQHGRIWVMLQVCYPPRVERGISDAAHPIQRRCRAHCTCCDGCPIEPRCARTNRRRKHEGITMKLAMASRTSAAIAAGVIAFVAFAVIATHKRNPIRPIWASAGAARSGPS